MTSIYFKKPKTPATPSKKMGLIEKFSKVKISKRVFGLFSFLLQGQINLS